MKIQIQMIMTKMMKINITKTKFSNNIITNKITIINKTYIIVNLKKFKIIIKISKDNNMTNKIHKCNNINIKIIKIHYNSNKINKDNNIDSKIINKNLILIKFLFQIVII